MVYQVVLHQTTIVACVYIMSDTIDKYFHPVVLYENYLICIFMNINENLKMRKKHWMNQNKTYIERLGHFLMDVYLFTSMQINIVLIGKCTLVI